MKPINRKRIFGIIRRMKARIRPPKSRRGSKIFCIGRNKTGTTSLEQALKDLGYKVGNQGKAELLIHDYARRDFRSIVRYCYTSDAFQDIPFSLPYTYIALDNAFPHSKFILSVRDDENEWYDSLIKWMMKRYRITGIPKKEHMVNDNYRYPGFIWEANRIMYETPEQEPLSEKILKEHYLRHNQDVQRYFKFREDLLVINLKESSSYQKFCDFLGHTPQYADFPWLNKSSQFISRR